MLTRKELKKQAKTLGISDYCFYNGKLYYDENKYKKAYKYLKKAVKYQHNKSDNLDYTYLLANVASKLGKANKAKKLYLEVIELDGDMFGPVAIDAFRDLAYIYYQEKDYLQAILHLGVFFVNSEHVEDEEYELYNKIHTEHISLDMPTIEVSKDEIKF
ncbi:MAG: tetratricopeptide repeat protein [Campylobacterota bacterium]|nr:tetratricopeptide repeat protein [Campylobacterota bacterium]